MSEARVVEFGGINTTAVSQAHRFLSPDGFDKPYLKKEDISNGHIVSMLSYNNCRTNFTPLQQGEVIYRFAITSGKSFEVDAFAENFVYPATIIPTQTVSRSISLSAENLNVTCFKCAEDNEGYIIRIKEVKGIKTDFTLNISDYDISSIHKCTLFEENICQLEGDKLSIDAYETLTLRVK